MYISEIGGDKDIDRIKAKDINKVECESKGEDILDFVYIREVGGVKIIIMEIILMINM